MKKFDKETLDCIGVPTFLLEPDATGQIVYSGVNQAWISGTGLRRDQVIGKTALRVFPGRLGDVAYQHHTGCYASAEPTTYDLMLPLPNNVRQAHTSLMPVLDAQGRVIQIVGNSIDVTADAEAKQMVRKAKTLTHEIEGFISLAAHDLRTPMRHVAAVAYMLREDFEDHGDGKLELINLLEKVAVKASELITDVLSHAQATQADAAVMDFDLHALCQDIFVTLDPQQRHIFDCPPATLHMDKVALQIVLRNLFDNALKHSERHQVCLRISVRPTAGDALEISVQDNGKGFKNPALAFLDGGKLRVESGFGLLGIRRLIKARGGEISAGNLACGAGSVIRFVLPGRMLAALPPAYEIAARSSAA